MSANATQLICDLRAEFETLLNLVTGSAAQTATVDQMERSLGSISSVSSPASPQATLWKTAQ